VPLRVEFERRTVLGEVDGQLRHPQQWGVDAKQPMAQRSRRAPTACR
jgi:hypothetical protein